VSRKIRRQYAQGECYPLYLPINEWAPFIIFGLQTGSELLKDNNTYGNFSSPAFKKAFAFLIDFYHQGLAPTGLTQVTNIYKAFSQGYIAMYISGPWNVPEFKKWMKGDLADQWMTAVLPSPDGETPGYSIAGGSSLVMNRYSKHKKEAWKFIEYLSTVSSQLTLFKLQSDLPAVKDAWNDTLLLKDPYMKAFYNQFRYVKSLPKIPEWEQIAFSKVQQYVEYAARGKMTVDEALKKLDEDVNKILEKRRWLLKQKVHGKD